MPVIEEVLLSDLAGMNKHAHEQVAWAQGEDDAYGCDRYVVIISGLRQIYTRCGQHRSIKQGEQRVVRDLFDCAE